MTEIRYYPLVDCNTDGTEKVAMFPTLDSDAINAQSKLWLEEMILNYFRLRCQRGQFPRNDFSIRCPRCAKPLARMSKTINETTRALYVCGTCVKKQGGNNYGNNYHPGFPAGAFPQARLSHPVQA